MKTLFTIILVLSIVTISLAEVYPPPNEESIITTVTASLEESQMLANGPCDYSGNVCNMANHTFTDHEILEQKALQYEQIATKYQNNQDYANATFYCNKAFEIYSNSRHMIKDIQLTEKLADILYQSGDHDKAIPFYSEVFHAYKIVIQPALSRKVAPMFEQAATQHQASGDYMHAVWYYKFAGDAYRAIGDDTKADQLYNLAAQEFESHGMQVSDPAPGNAGVEYIELSDLYKQLYDKSKSIEMQSRAKALLKSRYPHG